MHALYNLYDMLCKELEKFGERGDLTAGSLATIDTLAHAMKNLDKVIMAKEEEGGGSYEGSYDEGSFRSSRNSMRGSYDDGMSNRGYSSRRDSMGRYSRVGSYRGNSRAGEKDGFIRKLQELVDTAPDDKTRMHVERLIRQMDQS